MSKHTPGPWRIAQEEGGWYVRATGPYPDDHYICRLSAFNPGVGDGDLIAAAPDLLEALRPVAEEPVRDDLICHAGLVPKEKCGRCGRILAARAAIAKAEGK